MKLLSSFCLASLLVASASAGELLGQFDFSDIGHRSAPMIKDKAVIISALTFGVPSSHAVGFSQGAQNIYFAAAPYRDKYPDAKWPRTAEEAVKMAYYAEFHVSAQAGMDVTMEGISLKYGGSATADTGPGVANFYVHVQLRSSADNYEVPIGESAPFKIYPLKPAGNTEGTWKVNLSSQTSLEKIGRDGVTFRLYVWADGLDEEPTYSNSIRLDDIRLFGTTSSLP